MPAIMNLLSINACPAMCCVPENTTCIHIYQLANSITNKLRNSSCNDNAIAIMSASHEIDRATTENIRSVQRLRKCNTINVYTCSELSGIEVLFLKRIKKRLHIDVIVQKLDGSIACEHAATPRITSHPRSVAYIARMPTVIASVCNHVTFDCTYSSVIDAAAATQTVVEHPNLPITCNVCLAPTVCHRITSDTITCEHKVHAFIIWLCYVLNLKKEQRASCQSFIVVSPTQQVTITPIANLFKCTAAIAGAMRMKMRNIVFVYDLETTGVYTDRCNIISHYFHEMTHDTDAMSGFVAHDSKLDEVIKCMTGICDDDLRTAQSQRSFTTELRTVLASCDNPTLVAHNGHSFDHRIVRRYLSDAPAQVINWIDSKQLIYHTAPHARIRANDDLSTCYTSVLGCDTALDAHRASNDVMMVLAIFEKLKISRDVILRISFHK